MVKEREIESCVDAPNDSPNYQKHQKSADPTGGDPDDPLEVRKGILKP